MSHRLVLPVLGLTVAAFATFACNNGKEDDQKIVTRTAEGTSVSPAGETARARDVSMVRFVNAIPGSTGLKLMGDSVAIFSDVAFGTASAYSQVADNVVRFSINRDSATGIAAQNNEVMRDGGRYTVLALPDKDGGMRLRIVRDDLTPEAGKARVRLFHAAPGFDDVDLSITGQNDALIEDVDYGAEGGFKDVMPGMHGFTIRRDDAGKALTTIAPRNMVAGTAYTVVLASRPNASLVTFSFEDAPQDSTLSARR
jgi:Domain of unknown function (DUF4397)